jgi:hypothetical protein
MNVLTEIKLLLNNANIELEEEVQSLWSGYGQILRCKNNDNGQRYIVKVIAPDNAGQHPRGWNTSASHQRKIISYQVETHFYQHYASVANAQVSELCKSTMSRVPQLIACTTNEHFTLLIMEDLDDSGFFVRKNVANWPSLRIAIRWLAYFHARFMGTSAKHLWQVGSYWHLDTRQDELFSMPDSDYKTYASLIDQALNNAQFQTLIHGDAKFENLCFHSNEKHVAAVDFQYTGRGVGVKDLAYLVGSCLPEEKLIEFDSLIINEYLAQLKQAFCEYNIHIDFDALAAETIKLYPVAWADFYRFLLGWNPQSWKVCDYMKTKANIGLMTVKSAPRCST